MRVLLPMLVAFLVGCAANSGMVNEAKKINITYHDEPILLEGDTVLDITNARYIQEQNIRLKDNATLRIINSEFELKLKKPSNGTAIEILDAAQIVITNSTLRSSGNWRFSGHARLTVINSATQMWVTVTDNARAIVNSSPFSGWIEKDSHVTLTNIPFAHIALVLDAGSVVQEQFAPNASKLIFPNQDDKNIRQQLRVMNATNINWEVVVNPRTNISIGNSNIAIHINAGWPWEGVVLGINNIRPGLYDRTFNWEDSHLILRNTTVREWVLNPGATNKIIAENSDIAQVYGWGDGVAYLINSSLREPSSCAQKFTDRLEFAASNLIRRYASTINENQEVTLRGNDVLQLNDTHYLLSNKIHLYNRAKLIVDDSYLELTHSYPLEHGLFAHDDSKVIVRNSKIKSSPWLNWNFDGAASLTLENIDDSASQVWHSFGANNKVIVKNAKFKGTLSSGADVYIENSSDVFPELYYPGGVVIDEEFAHWHVEDYLFPNNGEKKIPHKIRIKNSTITNWGITLPSSGQITLRNSKASPTFTFNDKIKGKTVELSNLRSGVYQDQGWKFLDNSIRFINTTIVGWTHVVSPTNQLIIRNSNITESTYNWGDAKVDFYNSTIYTIRAYDNVILSLTDSIVVDYLVVEENATVHLNNTMVRGEVTQKGGQLVRG